MRKLIFVLVLIAMSLVVLAAQAGACGGWNHWPCY